LKNYTKLQMIYLYTYIQLLNWGFMSKKMKERNMMGKMKNKLMIQKNMLRVEMAFNDSADNNGKKIAIMKMTIID